MEIHQRELHNHLKESHQRELHILMTLQQLELHTQMRVFHCRKASGRHMMVYHHHHLASDLHYLYLFSQKD